MLGNCIIAPKILLPKVDDMSAWAVIACDQFTSDEKYWKTLEETVRGKKSAFNLIFPEIYLNDRPDERIAKINADIKSYIDGGVFEELEEGFILTVRKTPFVGKRIGLVGAIDLDKYDYSPKSSSLIRATEGVIEERIPPRVKIRKDAEAEFPHVMVLIDDEKKEILEGVYEERASLKKLYDFELNMGGGHIEGYFVPENDRFLQKFSSLLDRERLIKKYGREDNFLIAVGDGNHSLATAKRCWEDLKKTLPDNERQNNPAKYALTEIVNVYDDGIYFEPIFRFVCGVDRERFVKGLKSLSAGKASAYIGGKEEKLSGENSLPKSISAVDGYIKEYIAENGGAVDYVHGEKQLKDLVDGRKDAVGVLFEKLDKKELFKYVSNNGAFPRKTFSMGEGVEKRYYLEGRKIK